LSTRKISTDENSEGKNRRQESNQTIRSIFEHLAKQYVEAGESEKAVTFETYAEERKERPYEGGYNKLQGRGEQRGVYLWQHFTKISVISMVLGTKNIPLNDVMCQSASNPMT